jgi:hypothetical protein
MTVAVTAPLFRVGTGVYDWIFDFRSARPRNPGPIFEARIDVEVEALRACHPLGWGAFSLNSTEIVIQTVKHP